MWGRERETESSVSNALVWHRNSVRTIKYGNSTKCNKLSPSLINGKHIDVFYEHFFVSSSVGGRLMWNSDLNICLDSQSLIYTIAVTQINRFNLLCDCIKPSMSPNKKYNSLAEVTPVDDDNRAMTRTQAHRLRHFEYHRVRIQIKMIWIVMYDQNVAHSTPLFVTRVQNLRNSVAVISQVCTSDVQIASVPKLQCEKCVHFIRWQKALEQTSPNQISFVIIPKKTQPQRRDFSMDLLSLLECGACTK